MHISNSIFTPESMKEMPFQFGRLRNGEIVVSERYILGPDGFQIPIEMRTKMMPNGMYQSIIRDITERKESEKTLQLKNEELSKLNAEKDKFFSIIAHDLRSPFNAFLGLTRMMEEELSALTMDEIQKIAENMGKSANMLFHLLENLLEWARMQQGLRSYNPKPFKLLSMVYKSIDLVFDSAEKKKINLGFNIPDDLIVIADEQMLESLMRNLVFNAIKFTPHGGHITIAASVKPDNSVEISIRDTGIGMNQKMIDDLFRLDAHTHRNGTDGELSTGLGLIICRDFVEKHGGKLWVESEEGKGSTFYFTLPGGN
jgi:signal transduction histidine kinase